MGRASNASERLRRAVDELIWTGSYGRTTIDQICRKAKVQKGSFYYFFDSKSDLAIAALTAGWEQRKPLLDSIFSPLIPPLERIRSFCQMGYEMQKDLKKQHGAVLGCPLFTLGSEICNQEKNLHKKVTSLLQIHVQYLASAIRDAHNLGMIEAPNAEAKASMLFAFLQGLMTQARIYNDVEILRDMPSQALEFLGTAKKKKAA